MSAGRIVVVDDDPQLRRMMRAALTVKSYEVGDARTGEEALEKLRSEAYDLVLLDINMPVMTGLETCKAIRANSEIAIIMLTVSNSEKDKVDALDFGPTITSRNLSAPRNCWPGFALRYGGCPCHPARGCSESALKMSKLTLPLTA
ncbi:MAG: response regulator transcription factor [Terriglobia bacterium]